MNVKRVPWAGVVALVVASYVWIGSTSAGAAATYTGTAVADLARHSVTVHPFAVEDVVDLGGLTSQASLSSSGESTAFAATPYPGSLLFTVPGVAAGATGLPLPSPNYPLQVSSSYPAEPEHEAQAGTIDLHATSDEPSSSASAVDGGDRTEATVRREDGDVVVARASSSVAKADFGPSLSLAGIRSTAVVRRTPGGKVERSTSFEVASATVLGQPLRFVDGRFELASVKLPLGGVAATVDDLLARLADQGLSVRVIDPVETPDGVESAGLTVSRTTDVSSTAVTSTTTFGRARASVANRALPGVDGLVGGDSSSLGAPTAGLGSVAPPTAALPSPAVAVDGGGTGTPKALVPASSIRPEEAPAGRFYPILVLAGACLVAVLDLFRKWGVRLSWMS